MRDEERAFEVELTRRDIIGPAVDAEAGEDLKKLLSLALIVILFDVGQTRDFRCLK